MNNKTKTSMILSTTTIAILAIMLIPSDAFADHFPEPQGSTLPSGDAEFWFHCTSLDPLSVDGDTTSNCSKVKSEAEASMDTYNDLGNDIDLTTSATFVDYIIYATDLGLFGDSAQATYPSSTGDYVRYNTWRDWGTTGDCTLWYAYNLEMVTNHEFGHTVGLLHADSSDNSVMVDSCHATKWQTVQTHDDQTLDDLY